MTHNASGTVLVEPGSELAQLLDKATAEPVLLEKDGTRFRLVPEENEDVWVDYDPDKVVEVIDKLAGSLSDVDADALIAAIYRAREDGSRQTDRP